MNDDKTLRPIDFSALDPTRDTARFESLTRRIAIDAMAARANSSTNPRSALTPVVAWSRYTIAAAAAVLIVASSALVAVPAPVAAAAPESLAESAGIPASLIAIATTNHPMAATDLVDAFDRMTVSAAGQ